MNLAYNMVARQPDTGRMMGVILAGPPGIGKTHALMSMVDPKDKEKCFARIPLAGKTKEDMVTYPVPHLVDGNAVILQAISEGAIVKLLKENIGDGFGMLLLDDVTAADPSVQNALLELVQFGRIGEYELGKNVLIAMTGNGTGDGAYAVEWSQALMGRSHFVAYEANFDHWVNLPCNRNLDPIVLGFLKENNQFFAPKLSDTDASKYFDENNVGPQPRTTTILGTSLVEKFGGAANFQPSLLFPSLHSYVSSLSGQQFATAFKTFADLMVKYPSAEELFNNHQVWNEKLTLADRNNKGAQYTAVQSIKQYYFRKLEAITKEGGRSSKDKIKDLTDRFIHAVAVVMNKNRDIGAFAISSVIPDLKAKPEYAEAYTALYPALYSEGNGEFPFLEEMGVHKIRESLSALRNGLASE